VKRAAENNFASVARPDEHPFGRVSLTSTVKLIAAALIVLPNDNRLKQIPDFVSN